MNLVFVGCGKIARSHAAAAISLGAKIGAASGRAGSLNLKSFQKEFDVQTCTENWRDLLTLPGVDGLVICVPWNEIETIAMEVVGSGLPCLIEKPLALTAEGAKKIRARAGANSSRIAIGYNRRFYEFMPILREKIASGGLLSVDMDIPEVVPVWAKQSYLAYMTSHWLDLVSNLCGDLRLEYQFKGVPSGGVSAILSTRGVPVHLRCAPGAPAQISLSFYFQDSVYQLKPVERLSIFGGMEKIVGPTGNSYRPILSAVHEVDSRLKPGFVGQMRFFLENCIQGNATGGQSACSLEEAVVLAELCDALTAQLRQS